MKKSRIVIGEILIFLAVSIIFGILFQRVIMGFAGDYAYHNQIARMLFTSEWKGQDFLHIYAYPLYHIIIKSLAFVIRSYELASIVIMTFCIIITALLYRRLFISICGVKNELELILYDLISIAFTVFMPVVSPLTDWKIYAGVCGPNPIHNPTYILMRPLGLITCILFVRFIDEFNSTNCRKNMFLCGLFIILTTVAKPSFSITYLPAMGIIVLINMIRKKELKIGITSGIMVLPALIILLAQFLWTNAVSVSDAKMRIMFGSFSEFSLLEVIGVSLATFPIVLVLFDKELLKSEDNYYILSLIGLVFGWIEMFFFTNGPTGDFSWGYDMSVCFSCMISYAYAYKLARDERKCIKRFGIASAFLIYQVGVGVYYYWNIFCTLQFLM